MQTAEDCICGVCVPAPLCSHSCGRSHTHTRTHRDVNMQDPAWVGLSARLCTRMCAASWHRVGTQPPMCTGPRSQTLRGYPQPEVHRLSLQAFLPCQCVHASFVTKLAVPSTLPIPAGPPEGGVLQLTLRMATAHVPAPLYRHSTALSHGRIVFPSPHFACLRALSYFQCSLDREFTFIPVTGLFSFS